MYKGLIQTISQNRKRHDKIILSCLFLFLSLYRFYFSSFLSSFFVAFGLTSVGFGGFALPSFKLFTITSSLSLSNDTSSVLPSASSPLSISSATGSSKYF